nr:MAG TPA: hypothetical protein [Caudoviricetes sp.]
MVCFAAERLFFYCFKRRWWTCSDGGSRLMHTGRCSAVDNSRAVAGQQQDNSKATAGRQQAGNSRIAVRQQQDNSKATASRITAGQR